MTFHGTPKWAPRAHAHAAVDDHASARTRSRPTTSRWTHGHDDHGHGHDEPHESPWVMLVPLLVLAVGASSPAVLFDRAVHRRGPGRVLARRDLHRAGQPRADRRATPCRLWVVWAPLAVTVDRLLIAAWYVYILHEGLGARIAARSGPAVDLPLQQVVLRRALRRRSSCAAPRRWATCSGRAATRRSSTAWAPTAWPRSRAPSAGGPAGSRPATSTTTPSSCCSASRAC